MNEDKKLRVKKWVLMVLIGNMLPMSPVVAQHRKVLESDVCIYGGTSAGVIAAYTAMKMGKTAVLIEPGRHLGGLTSGGLGYTDIGNKYVVTGLARDFYRRIGAHYGKLEQWIFEPKVAESIFNDYVRRAGFPVLFERRIIRAGKKGNRIHTITLESTRRDSGQLTVRAKVFIDCSYEGDLMAAAGVSYAVGREANSRYQETINGVQLMEGHQFPDGIDPYKIPGDPGSGLLWGISTGSVAVPGAGDKKVQAYNYRITLTNVPENRLPIGKPDRYDPARYALLLRLKERQPWKSLKDIFIWSRMPNGKTDINNRGGFSTDLIGMNWAYPEAGYDERARIQQLHEDYTRGLLYFVGHDPRVPDFIREEMKQWGYPKDEYMDNDNWTPQLYIREARRMVGALVITQHHCTGEQVVTDGVGMAAYTMDSHNCDRQVVNGMVKNEGNVEVGGFDPYPVSYRAITPKQKEASNLLVPVCLSASHIAFGSIRMEPVFMVLGQSAAVAACLAIDQRVPVQQVDVTGIQKELKQNPLADGSAAEILIDNEDSTQVVIRGDWERKKRGGYGPSYLLGRSKAGVPPSVRFIPGVKKQGPYQIYAYFPKLKNTAIQTVARIHDGKSETRKTVGASDVQVQGQTSGEWVALGTYVLTPGQKAFVELSGSTPVADAILFVPGK
ncbi:FAD-dependent oxidoreductase [Niabella aurantiaca]|uniref:FAD-dependent oxidoreductase n=1 Tax=Niabella aurantiaca TaxID=379900 RepID=UPI00035FE802|nr:FAD-dependent oxidoreductase [Niabella aurantiaca]